MGTRNDIVAMARVARDVAAYLPGFSVAEPEPHNDWRVDLQDIDRLRIFIYTQRQTGRFEIRGATPPPEVDGWRYHINYGEWPSITCNATKSAQQIARDIERRLLPEYRQKWQEYITARDSRRAYVANAQRVAGMLRNLFGDKATWRASSFDAAEYTFSLGRYVTSDAPFTADIRVAGSTVYFAANTDTDEATLTLARALTTIAPE